MFPIQLSVTVTESIEATGTSEKQSTNKESGTFGDYRRQCIEKVTVIEHKLAHPLVSITYSSRINVVSQDPIPCTSTICPDVSPMIMAGPYTVQAYKLMVSGPVNCSIPSGQIVSGPAMKQSGRGNTFTVPYAVSEGHPLLPVTITAYVVVVSGDT